MDDANEFVGSMMLLHNALQNRTWPPRRWMCAYGAIDHLPIDGDSALKAVADEYRTIRRGKQQQLKLRASYGYL